ncbi:hypothetical protein GOP47_0011908 [Adiantum capillus-veneris]|uniref:Uncharacterized protein n=1 Tax=Adiantum capillus-veneris TaxID=13818 RepID=A0A9D4UU71_ADICA|nr:hypothetical protein GOP47_0011908 [Adiantum capillus-veneris]
MVNLCAYINAVLRRATCLQDTCVVDCIWSESLASLQQEISGPALVACIPQSVHSKRRHSGQEATQALFVLSLAAHILHPYRPRQCQARHPFATTSNKQYNGGTLCPY